MRDNCKCNNTKTIERIDNFYMVYRIGGNAPRVVHQTAPSAVDEAKRLAKQHVGETFVVMQSAGAFKCEMPEPQYVPIR